MLTAKQQRFVEEYLIDLNATQAATRAGYSEKTARSIGQENLTKPEVIEAITAAQAARSERTEIKVDRVVAELAAIGLSDPRRFFTATGELRAIHTLDDEAAAALASVEVVTKPAGEGAVEYVHKIKAWDKVSALDKLMRHLGGYAPEQHEHTGKDGGPIELSDLELGKRLAFLLDKAVRGG